MNLSDALPQTSGTVTLQGLKADVTVARDHWGIPHIRAQSAADAFCAQGFVHAQDRMWHMEWDRRRAYGCTAELVGASGVETDRLGRCFQIERASKADWETLNAETRAMLESFTAGVNAFIARAPVPSIEFKVLGIRPAAWQPWDCLSIFKIRHVLMGVIYNKIWRLKVVLQVGAERAAALYPDYLDGHPMIIPPDSIYQRQDRASLDQLSQQQQQFAAAARLLPDGDGSNNWVVDGTKTQSGKPLLAGDPHRPIDVPNVYYQNHLTCPEFDVIGVSFPGVPAFSHLGHSQHVAWAITHAGADYQDLYIERFDPQDPTRYAYKGEWHKAETCTEQIKVKGGADVVLPVRRTHHGPIFQDAPWPHHAIAMRYTAFEPGKTFECFLPMMRARSAEELRAAQREWVDPAQNLIIADVDGNIAYHTRGRLPIRPEANGWLPVPGWSGAHEWNGYIPFDEMSHTTNPTTHFIATANNKIVDDDYPYFISVDTAPGYRYARIAEVLRPMSGATATDFVKLQADRLSLYAREMTPHLIAACNDEKFLRDNPTIAKAIKILSAWNYRLEPDSIAATIHTTCRDVMMRVLLEPVLGADLVEEMFNIGRGGGSHAARLRSHVARFIETNDTRLLEPSEHQRESWTAVLRSSMQITIMALKAILGKDITQWQWRRLHVTNPVHPLHMLPEVDKRFNPPRVPYGGDGDTVQAAGYFPSIGYTVQGTQCYRQIIDLGDLAHARWVVPLGASGHPGSPHFADQVELWRQNQHVPMLCDWKEIEAQAEAKLELKCET